MRVERAYRVLSDPVKRLVGIDWLGLLWGRIRLACRVAFRCGGGFDWLVVLLFVVENDLIGCLRRFSLSRRI